MNRIELKDINKEFMKKEKLVKALKNINYNFSTGKFYAIIGHSGSGKSTLLNVIGTTSKPTSGQVFIDNKEIYSLGDREISNIRMKELGFVFQEFNLNKKYKAIENVMTPMYINKEISNKDIRNRAMQLLEMMGLKGKENNYPKELSGGEQQRVAIARALANNPDIILADEPTGNLDEENEHRIFEILKKLSKDNKCVIVVSHSTEIKEYADEVIKLEDGKIV